VVTGYRRLPEDERLRDEELLPREAAPEEFRLDVPERERLTELSRELFDDRFGAACRRLGEEEDERDASEDEFELPRW
jgi:hypothetical protein